MLSCSRLCDPIDCSPPGSSAREILQARILEWVPSPTPGDLPDPGTEPKSPVSPASAGGFFTTVPPGSLLEGLVQFEMLKSNSFTSCLLPYPWLRAEGGHSSGPAIVLPLEEEFKVLRFSY